MPMTEATARTRSSTIAVFIELKKTHSARIRPVSPLCLDPGVPLSSSSTFTCSPSDRSLVYPRWEYSGLEQACQKSKVPNDSYGWPTVNTCMRRASPSTM